LIFEILKPGFAQARAALGLQAAQYPRRGASL
jgi:hypothetical protein